jgi:single-strand DNA-binding protein
VNLRTLGEPLKKSRLIHMREAVELSAKGTAITSYNKVMLLGNLGHDPEIRYTPMGLPVVNFIVATDESEVDNDGKKHEHTEWHRVVVAGKLALTCNEYLKKGQLVFVEGRLRTRKVESESENGRQRYTEIVSNRVQFLDAHSRKLPNNAVKPSP